MYYNKWYRLEIKNQKKFYSKVVEYRTVGIFRNVDQKPK